MKLIGSSNSAYVRKVRVVLAEKKLEYQFEAIDAWSPESDIAAINPLGKVPALVLLKSGEVVYDSRVIVEYLDSISPVGKLIPPSGRERLGVRIWEALCDGVLDAASSARLEATWSGRNKAQRCDKWIQRQMDKVHAGLAEMARQLADKPYCAGAHFSLADVCAGCTLGWLALRFPEIGWRDDYPHLAALHDKLMQRASFADTAPQP